MSRESVIVHNLTLSFTHKTCFENWSTTIDPGDQIAIIGNNGRGKSSLLKILAGLLKPSEGQVEIPDHVKIAYVPQVIEDLDTLSGGERLYQSIASKLLEEPDILLLDEPTNHLDRKHRQNLMRLLDRYSGILVLVSHDTELLKRFAYQFWHLENGKINIFNGGYEEYKNDIKNKRLAIENQLNQLKFQKQSNHQSLMKEQERASKRKAYGEKKYEGDTIALRSAQGKGEQTHNKNKKLIGDERTQLSKQLSELRLPEVIRPQFSLTPAELGQKTLVFVREGSVGYEPEKVILHPIDISLKTGERLALVGDNGSGKTTLLKALMGDPTIWKKGVWQTPDLKNTGYLDQHYGNLNPEKTVLESLWEQVPTWTKEHIREHLNDFFIS